MERRVACLFALERQENAMVVWPSTTLPLLLEYWRGREEGRAGRTRGGKQDWSEESTNVEAAPAVGCTKRETALVLKVIFRSTSALRKQHHLCGVLSSQW